MLLIVVAKINLAVRVNKHFTNKIANRQEKNEKVSNILSVNCPYPFVRSFIHA